MLDQLVEKLRPDARVTVLTGAGVSAASGVPTFRGPDGLWRNFRPESLATAEAFQRDPRLVWEWYDWRRQVLSTKQPNCAHCDGLIRPGVVWFGEGIDPEVMRRSTEALDCDVFFTIGTSSLVYPAASLVHEAKARGAYTVEMNVEATPASRSLDLALQGTAEEVLHNLEKLLEES